MMASGETTLHSYFLFLGKRMVEDGSGRRKGENQCYCRCGHIFLGRNMSENIPIMFLTRNDKI